MEIKSKGLRGLGIARASVENRSALWKADWRAAAGMSGSD
jgi:hypothetical protein